MAYRKLQNGDHVKIVGKDQPYSGSNAIVINAELSETSSRVQILPWEQLIGNPSSQVICENVSDSKLLIRNEPNGWIIDGKINQKLKDEMERRQAENAYVNDYEPDERDEFDDYDRDDLVDKIIKLRNDVSTLTDALSEKESELEKLKISIIKG